MRYLKKLLVFLAAVSFFYIMYTLQLVFVNTPKQVKKMHLSASQVYFYNSNSEMNLVCPRPDMKHADSAARFYMEGDDLHKQECDVLDGKVFVFINDVHNGTHWLHSIQVNVNALISQMGVKRRRLYCEVKQFDKKFNEVEDYIEYKSLYNATKDNNFTVFVSHGYYDVLCYKLSGERVYNDQYMILPRDMSVMVKERMSFNAHTHSKSDDPVEFLDYDSTLQVEKKMNVIHIRIDSMSILHLPRAMPHLYKYLTEELENNIMFTFPNVVGEKTHSNMVPLYTNVVVEPIESAKVLSEKTSWLDKNNHFWETFPFIWYDYEARGYLTAFQEDFDRIGAFNNGKNGFRNRPVSVYGRPLWLRVYESKLKSGDGDSKECMHGRSIIKILFDNMEAFLDRMNMEENKNIPYFYAMWTGHYTHNNIVVLEEIDLFFTEMLRKFEKKGYFDNTMLYIFSDHGLRLAGYASKTETGKIERKLPFYSLRFPKQLWDSEFEANAIKNKDRLVSFYDMYQTFRHFLHINANHAKELDHKQFAANIQNVRHRRGHSVFQPMHVNRTCSEALIPDNYCVCLPRKQINEETFHKDEKLKFDDVVDFIIALVNNQTAEHRGVCVPFKKEKLNFVQSFEGRHRYQFVVIAQPGDAWFEATLAIENQKMSIFGKISRLSVYGNTSHCVNDPVLKDFCFCKDQF